MICVSRFNKIIKLHLLYEFKGLKFIEFYDNSREILEAFISENAGHLLRPVKYIDCVPH
jgi:hypothetical protein